MLSIVKLMGIELKIPNNQPYQDVRKKTPVKLLPAITHKNGTHIIIDGAGLSVYGSDEFYVMKDKVKKVKGCRRLHTAINEHQELVACELTSLHKSEA